MVHYKFALLLLLLLLYIAARKKTWMDYGSENFAGI